MNDSDICRCEDRYDDHSTLGPCAKCNNCMAFKKVGAWYMVKLKQKRSAEKKKKAKWDRVFEKVSKGNK